MTIEEDYRILNEACGVRPVEELKKVLKEYGIVGRLEKTLRRGWVIRGVEEEETVWEHTLRLVNLVIRYGQEARMSSEDMLRAQEMALIHDVPESETVDATPYDGITTPDFTHWPKPTEEQVREKTERERGALDKATRELPEEIRAQISTLWEEFAAQKTDIARIVRQLDIISAIMKAVEFVNQGLMPKEHLRAFREQAENEIDYGPLKTKAMSLTEICLKSS